MIGSIEATLGADAGALATSFLAQHMENADVRAEVDANGNARLREALAAMLNPAGQG
jgi:hypothetical protein